MEPSPVQYASGVRRRQIDVLLSRYAESHLHPVNEIIHCICVPAIVFALLALVWSAHPLAAAAAVMTSLIYYFFLAPRLALGMLLMASLMLALLPLLPAGRIWQIALLVFVLAWIGQFIGHHIEGKKPSFFDDLRFLLVGPLFVLGLLYRRCGWTY
ncbi:MULTISPECIES: DUF962 domain-containing protein [unclassified Undibacterium]|uniref:Mpo1 family 2-hydroxy fatty acid dioxygenase n=1 Tax=unclassified Undibacterium TaxID=2630295 RepID=UPI002AC8A946|nr:MULTISPECIES: Mpo1-like protein [unclassified Undibacterium]MEB0139955.1 DUF962 domain-containing protein [Undibacterium sp. CCC2.1]MEB0172928.1 DUF962 domain-containing protein [Undibacterium sp. CCC1.1]MEB0176755.1 DUF962 domain-containing protein [Undibacterium sp. CCC3.4]MEB0216898.1 DUF962 domain-containing protein [Undibacterium sp. 5I2]WPX44994.1 DUF962 domain-containing protein [Undibacterium sp. CCC3.4]